jgi:hypothetical protein
MSERVKAIANLMEGAVLTHASTEILREMWEKWVFCLSGRQHLPDARHH